MTGSSDSNLNRGDADPFSHLHKMSTTAGLGSGDYVAINGTAIAAILLGVGSALVLFNNPIFLLIPLFGLIAAILAFKQISASNGTQTGREVAALGLLLSIGFGGFFGAKSVYLTYRDGTDQDQIVSNVRKLGDLVKANSYPEAYALLDDRFKKRLTLPEFENGWRRMTSSPLIGTVQSMDWNKLLSFDVDPVDGSRLGMGMMLLKARPNEPIRMNMVFRNEGNGWLIDQIPQMFPPPSAPAAGSGGEQNGKNPTFIGPVKR
jgi:hypothetical protein